MNGAHKDLLRLRDALSIHQAYRDLLEYVKEQEERCQAAYAYLEQAKPWQSHNGPWYETPISIRWWAVCEAHWFWSNLYESMYQATDLDEDPEITGHLLEF